MGWARYDDELNYNRKIVALKAEGTAGIAAIGLHLLLNTHARNQGTGGRIGRREVNVIAGGTHGTKLARLLEAVGMLDADGDGWQIHDCAEYGDPDDPAGEVSAAEKRRQLGVKRAEAGRRGGQAKASKSVANGVANGEQGGWQSSTPVPVPVPDTTTSLPPPPVSDLSADGGGGPSRRSQIVLAAAEILLGQTAGQISNPVGWVHTVAQRLQREHADWLTTDDGYAPVADRATMLVRRDGQCAEPEPVDQSAAEQASGASYGTAVAQAQLEGDMLDRAAFLAELEGRPEGWTAAAVGAYDATLDALPPAPSNVLELRRLP